MRWQGLARHDQQWLRWAYWAAKESAYKALRRCDRTLVFAPHRFGVELMVRPDEMVLGAPTRGATELLHGCVRVQENTLALCVERGRHHLHAWVCREPLVIDQLTVASRQIAPTANPRRAVRELLRESLPDRERQGAPVRLERRGRVPTLCVGERRFPVSLSHHGRRVAIAFHLGGAAERAA